MDEDLQINKDDDEELSDGERIEKGEEDEILQEIADEFIEGDPNEALNRLEDAGYDIDALTNFKNKNRQSPNRRLFAIL